MHHLNIDTVLPLQQKQQQQLDLEKKEENDFQTFFCKSFSSHREDDKVGEMLILMIFFSQVITIYNFLCSHTITSNERKTKWTFPISTNPPRRMKRSKSICTKRT